jgi:hypothetical protein
VARLADSLAPADYTHSADYSCQAQDNRVAGPQENLLAFVDYSDYLAQTYSSRAVARLVSLLAAPGSAACQGTDTAGEPVAPAVAAVRRFSLISLFTAKLVLIIWCGWDRKQAMNSFGLPIMIL